MSKATYVEDGLVVTIVIGMIAVSSKSRSVQEKLGQSFAHGYNG